MTESSSEANVAFGASCNAPHTDDRSPTVRLPKDPQPRCQTLLLDGSADHADDDTPVSPQDPMRQAVAAAQSGNKPLARLHLEKAIESDPENPNCWLWLAWVADSPSAAISALEQARRNSIDTALIEHGLQWAQGMLEFKFDAGGSEAPARDSAAPARRENPRTQKTQNLAPGKRGAKAGSTPPPSAEKPGTRPAADDLDTDSGPGRTVPVKSAAPQSVQPAAPKGTKPAGSSKDVDPGDAANRTDEGTTEADDLEDCVDSIRSELDEFFKSINPLTKKIEPSTKSKAAPAGSASTTAESDRGKGDSQSKAPAPRPAEKTRPAILAVDDSPTIRSLVKICLEKCGYEVVTASDGMEALEPIKNRKLSLILMDINMPRLNGYQLCKLVKKNAETQAIPVIMLSGKDGVFDKLRGKLSGCDDYITKPFEAVDLVQKVSTYLRQTVSS